LIFLSHVAKYFNGVPLFKDGNISVHRGDRVGMVGPNGAGKSTILGMMEGVVTSDEGEVTVEKKIRIGVLHQELIPSNDRPIVEEVMDVSDELRRIREQLQALEEELEHLTEDSDRLDAIIDRHGRLQHDFERYGGYSLEARALKVLQGLGFQPEDAQRPWSEFSGGWRMRVALAKLLLAEPDVLLLDEPTNHLDLESLLWVEGYLTNFKGALVLVSHDRAFLNRLVNRIVEVDRGKVTTYSGNYAQYEKTKQMQEDVIFSAYRSQQEKIKRIQKFIDQNRVKARTASRVQSRVKMLDKMERIELPTGSRTVHFTFPQPARTGRRVVEIKDLTKRYGSRPVYERLNLVLERGDRVALVGPNGAGKSTLMKMIAGVVLYDAGTLTLGHSVKPGYFAQHQWESLNSELTVLLEATFVAQNVTEQEVRSLLGAFLFSGDDVYKRVRVLSGGEKSRLALVKILLAPPNLLLMDEPTNHLDIPSCEVLEAALKRYEGTLVLITHDRRLMNEICTGIVEIKDGSGELYHGNYDDYLYKKRLMEKSLEDDTEPKVKLPPQSEEDPGVLLRETRKDRKRREAESRKALSNLRTPILKEIRTIEEEMERGEARRQEIQSILADTATYGNRQLMLPLLEEEPALSKRLKELEARWEDLHSQLETIEKDAVSA
jgi:ATP-binding cassette subfamily F protein 3